MCVSVTDVCCDAGWSSVDCNIPAGKQITVTYIHYDTPTNNEVNVECIGFPNGEPGELIWSRADLCGCGNTSHSEQIAGPNLIRFRVKCMGCNSENCHLGSATVYFYTSTMTSCPPSCNPK